MTLVAFAVGIGGCGDSGPQTFSEDPYPFTFEYPGDFESTDDISFDSELGGSADDSKALGLDDSNAIVLQRSTLNIEINEDNVDRAKDEFDGLITQIDPSASGETGTLAGLPSLSYDVVSVPDPPGAESRLTILFEGDQEYVINCQSTPEKKDQLDAACAQALDSLAPR